MKNITKVVFLTAAALCALAEANSVSTAGPAAAVNAEVFKADYSTVWNSLVGVLRENNEKLSLEKKDKGIVRTEYRVIKPPEIKTNVALPARSESGGFRRSWLWARYKSEILLKKLSDNETKVEIKIRYEGWNASAGRYVRVISNGEKEKAILKSLGDSIAAY